MKLKLESNLRHQAIPVDGVATIVEASIQEPAKASHQNPIIRQPLNGEAIRAVRQMSGILAKAEKLRVSPDMLPDKVKALPGHGILDIKMEAGTGKTFTVHVVPASCE